MNQLKSIDLQKKKFQLKPDIVINNGKIIVDTKWKLLSEDKTHQGISQADMYQLYAYGTKYKDCEYIYLIYPYDGQDIVNSYTYFQENEQFANKEKLYLNVLLFDISNEDIGFLDFKQKEYEIFKGLNQ